MSHEKKQTEETPPNWRYNINSDRSVGEDSRYFNFSLNMMQKTFGPDYISSKYDDEQNLWKVTYTRDERSARVVEIEETPKSERRLAKAIDEAYQEAINQ